MRKKSASLVLLARDSSESLGLQITRQAEKIQGPLKRILTKAELGDYHKARPLAVLTITHRGVAKRLSREIDSVTSLMVESEKGFGRRSGHNGLTGSDDRGMMPQTQAGA
jgi:ribosomal protein L7Ae-like RNA K-turn-binding protein